MTVSTDASGSLGSADAAEVRLDELFCRSVRRSPDSLALVDPPDRPSFTQGICRRLTYHETGRAVTMLALKLQALGLMPGAVVAMQLPNTVESVVALLAILRADLVAAPLPLLWRQAEAVPALAQVGARALITSGQVAGTDYGEIARNIAAETFGIRFVCGFGEEVADGMVALGDIFAAHDTAAVSADFGHADEADGTAIITFETGPEGPSPIRHTHTELLVGGLAIVLESGMRRKANLVGTMLTSSYTVLAATIVPWLMTGGTLALQQPFELSNLAAQLAEIRCDVVVLPGPLVAPLAEAGVIGGSEGPTILGVWRSPEQQPGSGGWRGAAALIDVLAFSELGLIALRRGPDGEPAAMVAGPLTVPSGAAAGTVVMSVERTPHGTLALSGPMVPRSAPTQITAAETPPADDRHFVDTGYPSRIDPVTRAITLRGPPAGIVRIGGYRFAMAELQDLVSRAGADGILAALPHLLSGQKLAGAAGDAASVQRALAALGISPLIAAAFRDRLKGRANSA